MGIEEEIAENTPWIEVADFCGHHLECEIGENGKPVFFYFNHASPNKVGKTVKVGEPDGLRN